jgi:hypothetical protein
MKVYRFDEKKMGGLENTPERFQEIIQEINGPR